MVEPGYHVTSGPVYVRCDADKRCKLCWGRGTVQMLNGHREDCPCVKRGMRRLAEREKIKLDDMERV